MLAEAKYSWEVFAVFVFGRMGNNGTLDGLDYPSYENELSIESHVY